MLRSFAGGIAVGIWIAAGVHAGMAAGRMQFEWELQGPAEACVADCMWISASGFITADTPKDFEAFVQDHDVRGTILALNSEGGSVLGTLALGRMIRDREMVTTIGRAGEPDSGKERRADVLPDGTCESMCVFLLLAGTQRYVPAEAKVLVHQIWIGNKRVQAAELTYTAEEVDTIERDIGSLARYTFEMGGTVDLLDAALQIPPWAPLRKLSPDELRRMRLSTVDRLFEFAPPKAPPSIPGVMARTVAQQVTRE